jgi:hypothetical protein
LTRSQIDDPAARSFAEIVPMPDATKAPEGFPQHPGTGQVALTQWAGSSTGHRHASLHINGQGCPNHGGDNDIHARVDKAILKDGFERTWRSSVTGRESTLRSSVGNSATLRRP